MIHLKHISKRFTLPHKSFLALDDISIFVPKGLIFGIVGESGAGKSTLLRSINLLERPDKGEVFIGDQDLMKLDETHLRKMRQKIGMIFQQFNLVNSKTVFDNIALPLTLLGESKAKIKEEVWPLIEYLGLTGKEREYPHELSGGQRQRVAIARSLILKPEILLCDEATSALDPKTTNSILELLERINKELNLTIVLITHELSVIKSICHRVAVLSKGKVQEESDILDFFSNPKHLPKVTIPDFIQQNYPIIRLIFKGNLIEEAFISKVSRDFNVDISILYGNIEYIKHKPVGFLIVQIKTQSQRLKYILEYFNSAELKWEIINHAPFSNL